MERDDHQPLSIDLRPGVGSGALTLGGTDPLLHNTAMVFAENITPLGGWYPVRIKAMFLRTKGGTLSEPYQDEKTVVEYLRVNAKEDVLNGSPDKSKGVIIDSGTTDTYLPQGLKAAFDEAWKMALGSDSSATSKYHNNPTKMTPEEVESLPTILLVLKGHSSSNANNENAIGMTRSHKDMFKESQSSEPISKSDVVVAIPPTHYMEESRGKTGTYTARVYFTERYGAQSILGSNVLMGHEVNFDIGRGRIGFAESHCDYSRYVEERDAKQQEEVVQRQQEDDIISRVAQNSANEENKNSDGAREEDSMTHMESDLAASGWARR